MAGRTSIEYDTVVSQKLQHGRHAGMLVRDTTSLDAEAVAHGEDYLFHGKLL